MSERPRPSRAYYSRNALIAAVRDVGVSAGETVLSHVGVGMLGYPEEGASEQTAWAVIADAFRTVLGESGTWLVPTYSYTFTKPGEVYAPDETPSDVGPFTDYFRRLPGARRSADPIFSVAALGPRAEELLSELPHDCFGVDSIYGRLTRAGAKLCNVGVGFRYATYVHHVEQSVGVPYRFSKYFTGIVRDGAEEREETWHYYVRALEDPAGLPDLRRLEAEARQRELVRSARVGLGELTCVPLPALYELATECVGRDPWFMARGGAEDYSGDRPDQRGRVEFSPEREPGRSDR
jgi:aminoglycoside 3-N-acetyltransferase